MEVGLLWFDDSKDKSLEVKVDEAVAAYCAKPRFAGKTPNTCYVHTTMFPEGQEIHLNGVRIAGTSTIPPHHFFVGVEHAGSDGRDRPRRDRRRSRGPKS